MRTVGLLLAYIAACVWSAVGVCAAVTFGHDMRKHFFMAEGVVNLNHGSFGTVARPAYAAEQQYYMEMESDPNTWFRGKYQPLLVTARQRLAALLNAQVADVVMIENASAGLNAILRSLPLSLGLKAGDYLLRTSVAYPMVDDVYGYLSAMYGLRVLNVTIDFPVTSGDAFLQPVEAALQALPYGAVRVCAFDHIASYPAVVLPLARLGAICKQYGAAVVVADGAHAAGQIAVDVTAFGESVDLYVSNLHKWMYSPKGTAVLWANGAANQKLVVPTVVSSPYTTDFVDAFAYTGTRNYCAFLALPAAMDFRESIGGESAITSYIQTLAWNSAQAVAAVWNTTLLVPVRALNAALIDIVTPTQNGGTVSAVRAALLSRYNTYVQTSVTTQGVWYLRISAQIYLDESDFTTMAQRFLQLMREFERQTTSLIFADS